MQKRWQFFVILAVILLTVYNILPTVFYYYKPLKNPISQTEAQTIGKAILKRVNSLEDSNLEWLKSYIKLLNVKPKTIAFIDHAHIKLTFEKISEANFVKKYLPRAAALISFAPAQLTLEKNSDPKTIVIKREVPVHFDLDKSKNYFKFDAKFEANGVPTTLYKELVFDRVSILASSLAGLSDSGLKASLANEGASQELLSSLAHDLIEFSRTFGEKGAAAQRFYASFTQTFSSSKEDDINTLISLFSKKRSEIKLAKSQSQKKPEKLQLLEKEENLFIQAESLLKKYHAQFSAGQKPVSYNSFLSSLETIFRKKPRAKILTLNLKESSVLFNKILIDWANNKLILKLHPDVLAYKNKPAFRQIIINEVAKIQKKTAEELALIGDEYVSSLNRLSNSSSILALDLKEIASSQLRCLKSALLEKWQPQNEELKAQNYPIYDYPTYLKVPQAQKKLCFILYSPLLHGQREGTAFENHSVYLISKGLNRIIQKYQAKESVEAQNLSEDFKNLEQLLKQNGLYAFSASRILFGEEFDGDVIFQKNQYYLSALKATREQFSTLGSSKWASLELADFEQRLLTLNKIEGEEHEELIKWKDDYFASQLNTHMFGKYDVPPPTKNPFINNCLLSLKKYFRGDQRKILHWGLDLSGGKTVQIELRDQNNKPVKNEADLKQGLNELYSRVNKMGVSDVNIRLSDTNIILDFPGAQNLSASELIKASSMFFHIVNEKFSYKNSALADSSSRFLQEVWNEALVTGQKDVESINAIAYHHLYGEGTKEKPAPRSEAAKTLLENGLNLPSKEETLFDASFNNNLSKIAILRDSEHSKWEGQTHPLLIIFSHHALEGTNLTNISPSYDPTKGNFLRFDVKGSQTSKNKKNFDPRDGLYSWTSQYAQEKIIGSELDQYSHGSGWRMAIVLNDSVISAPPLKSAIRSGAMIEGSFTQREITQLTSDLKAGSLSFTPHILSEKNVSPELGKSERTQGILATFIALAVVIIAMISYYRFSGIIASVAVLFNLLIMWATLQNLQATLSLAGIAGIILTVGMAVDANVLVFERIREEFALSRKIGPSIFAGYRKAFSAILDSNITTIIAALILLNFDSGPIKGFAVTLIIGIISSVFTALFVTRYYFSRWIQNPKNTELKMNNLIKSSTFNFLSKAKYVITFSLIIIALGCSLLYTQKNTILGMDFTGGFALNAELVEKNNLTDYRGVVETALLSQGAKLQDVQIRELNSPNNLRLLFGVSMEQKGRPFHNLPLENDLKNSRFEFEKNPRISWVVSALKAKGLELTPRSQETISKSWTAMSGQMSDAMRFNAVIGLLIALLAIIIYITYRFEFKYAFSAFLFLVHDVLISLGSIAILNYFKVPMQIDLNTIAAIMTIIGYSLNDTIIIFDRIREELKVQSKMSLKEIVNHSLNITLSRTTITSLTTFLVLLMLAIFGGATLFGFAMVMIMGVVYGTLSSIFIAAPLMLFFHRLTEKKLAKRRKVLES